MKVYLLFPPNWTPIMPHLALPTLTAFLRARGVTVIQRDLNAEVFDWVLTREYLEGAQRQLSDRATQRQLIAEGLDPRELQHALSRAPDLARRIDGAVRAIRSPAFYDPAVSLDAFGALVEGLQLASLPTYPAALELTDYKPALPADSSRNLLQLARDERRNMFIELFRERVLPDIVREQPDIVGISIPTMNQMVAGLTMADLVKRSGLRAHVTIGGPNITMLRLQLPNVPRLFDVIDSAVVMDGELPLLRLAEALDCDGGHGDLSRVPNLVYRQGDRIRVNTATFLKDSKTVKASSEDFDPVPDYAGLPLDRYLAPDLILPMLVAHGCYHGTCGFCSVGYGEQTYRQLEADKVVEHMLALHERFGARHIFFADEAMTPRNLRVMARELQARGSPIHWGGCARFDGAFSRELLDAMARGGCRTLLFGLETASERMSAHMDKGVSQANVQRVLDDSAAAGIWNHTFFFFGFPTETLDDAQETVNFVFANREKIHSASPGSFVLERYAPAHMYPERFGVKRIIEDPAKDLAIYFDYEAVSGMDEKMADLVATRFVESLPEKRFGQYYVHDAWRFLYASHLAAQGLPMPAWLATEQVTS